MVGASGVVEADCEFVFKSGKTRSFLTESTYRGEALKERSEGVLAQRLAALREWWRRGTRLTRFSCSVSCRSSL